jgi:hypothetical protein
MRKVPLAAVVGLLIEDADILGERVVGNLKRDMRDGEGDVEEEGGAFRAINEGKGLVGDEVVRVMGSLDVALGVAFEYFLDRVPPEVRGVEVVGLALAVVAVEEVEALVERVAAGAGEADPPTCR